MAQVIKTTFQLRRGNLEVWERNNPILAKGEPSFVVDKNALKIGDGVTHWKELEYIGIGQDDLAKAIEDYFKENPGVGTGADGRGIVSIIRTDGDGSAGTIDTYTITYTDLTTSTFTIYNGKDGDPGNGIAFIEYEATSTPGDSIPLKFTLDNGDSYSITIPGGPQGESAYELAVRNGFIGTLEQWLNSLVGEPGPAGRGIQSITRTNGNGAPGTIDTYTITYTNDTASNFTIYNGKDGIGQDGFSPTATIREDPEGAVVEISDKNGITSAFIKHGKDGEDGIDGRGISSISLVDSTGTSSTGIIDTYKIKYTDGTSFDFHIRNGKDGSAAESEQREPQVFQVASFESLPTDNVYIGDFGIVKTQITNGKNSHTAFIYTENGWAALDGNYDANNVYFDEDLLVTTKIGTIQTLTNGQAILPAKGKTLKQVFSSLIAEKKNPTATLPSGTVELTNYENGNYLVEVGETITPTWKTTFSSGSYTYGPATGVTSTQANVYLSSNSSNSKDINAGEMNNKTGSLTAFQIKDVSTKHYAKVNYGWTQGTSNPQNNFGEVYTDTSKNLPIQAASGKSDTSTYYIQGYRKAFFGSRITPVDINSHNIRSLEDNANSSNSTLTVSVEEGANQVIIAVPKGRIVAEVADSSAFGQDILGSDRFTKYVGDNAINVGGADATSSNIGSYAMKYNVYVYNPAASVGKATYTVKLANE